MNSQGCKNEYSTDEIWLLKEKYQGVASPKFEADRQSLSQGTPLAYLIGHVPFLDTTIYLDSHPLIPRVETEYWIDYLIKHWQKPTPQNILDLCAGSGVIGIALAKHFPESSLTLAEIDPIHLPTIQKNCQENQIGESHYEVVVSNLFSEINKKYNLIVSNPPYIDQSLGRTAKSVLDHEPPLALFADNEGFALIKIIIEQAPNWLHPEGELWLEHEPEQTQKIHVLSQSNFLATTHKDQYLVERFTKLVLK